MNQGNNKIQSPNTNNSYTNNNIPLPNTKNTSIPNISKTMNIPENKNTPINEKNNNNGQGNEEKIEILNKIQNNINDMINIAKKRQGILFRPILNNSIKKIEIYQKSNKNNINLKTLREIDNIIKMINNQNIGKNELFQIIKEEGNRIITRNKETENIDIIVQGIVGIIQVIMGER
jgi:hypothetical protein